MGWPQMFAGVFNAVDQLADLFWAGRVAVVLHEGSTVVVVINSLRLLRYDRHDSPRPSAIAS